MTKIDELLAAIPAHECTGPTCPTCAPVIILMDAIYAAEAA